MRIVALLAVRNEAYYIERCLQHLYGQGIETCLIDNGSTDQTLEIAKKYLQYGVFRIEHIPFNGIYEWEKILQFKSDLANDIKADWFIHHDADEIREAPKQFSNLAEGIKAADEQGYNAINSDELVFVPMSDKEAFEGCDYVKDMVFYYHFKPKEDHRVNIWKKTHAEVDLVSTGGHSALFANRHLSPDNFILRHYILLSKRHAFEKYGRRQYDPKELAKGMHRKRAAFNPEHMKFPPVTAMKTISKDGGWDLSMPYTDHLFM